MWKMAYLTPINDRHMNRFYERALLYDHAGEKTPISSSPDSFRVTQLQCSDSTSLHFHFYSAAFVMGGTHETPLPYSFGLDPACGEICYAHSEYLPSHYYMFCHVFIPSFQRVASTSRPISCTSYDRTISLSESSGNFIQEIFQLHTCFSLVHEWQTVLVCSPSIATPPHYYCCPI